MSELILIRHSKVRIAPDLPAREWRLSVEGRRRSREMAQVLKKECISQVVTSLEQKAVETSQIVAEALRASWETAAKLHEHE